MNIDQLKAKGLEHLFKKKELGVLRSKSEYEDFKQEKKTMAMATGQLESSFSPSLQEGEDFALELIKKEGVVVACYRPDMGLISFESLEDANKWMDVERF